MKLIIKYLYSVLLWILIFFEGILLLVLITLIFIIAFPFDPKRKAVHLFSRFWGLHYFWIHPFWTIRYHNSTTIDTTKAYVIVCNHQSMFDIFALYRLPLLFKWVSKAEALKIPFIGPLLYLHGDILIKRGDSQSTREMFKKSENWIHKICSISIFPEGTRSKTGKIQDFKAGAFMIAKQNNLPILPVVIEGTRDAFPPDGILLGYKCRVQIHVLPIIDAETVSKTKTKDLSILLHNIMTEEHKKMIPPVYH